MIFQDIDDFKKNGLLALEDTTLAPKGAFAILQNAVITDRGGISPRPGTVLLGTQNTNSGYCTGLFNFRKSFGSDEVLIKTYASTFEAYSRNLSASSQTSIINTSGILAYYKFDEGSGTTATDSTSNANNASIINGAAYVPGKIGDALSFSSISSQVVRDLSFSPGTSANLTISFWAKPSSNSGTFNGFFSFCNTASDDYQTGITIDMGSSSTTSVSYINVQGAGFNLAGANLFTGTPLVFGTWHFYTVVINSGVNVQLYIDGVAQGSVTQDGSTIHLNELRIGARHYSGSESGYFNGQIDEVSIWTRSLSIVEISQLYAGGTGIQYPFLGSSWFTVQNGYTLNSEHGFVSSLVNSDNQDYVISCNRYEPYQRWSGVVATLTGTLVGGESIIPVSSTLNINVYESKTASASSATTLTVSGSPWAAKQWVGFFVHIIGTDNISQITDNTTSQITFGSLSSGDPGSVPFEIRTSAFPSTGTLVYAGNQVSYTAISATTFTVSSAAIAAPQGTVVTLIPDTYAQNPRGNRFASYLGRIIVGNVRSALVQNSAGSALQGYASAGSYFVSKLKNPVDFTYGSPRVPGDGDVIATPFGGGDITSVMAQENYAYIFKSRYVESVQYSQDANDLPNRVPLPQASGSQGKVIQGTSNLYFITADNKILSIGRIQLTTQLPETKNIGIKIKRLLDGYFFDAVNGFEWKDKVYIACKSLATLSANDTVIVYNKVHDVFEGTWNLNSFGFEFFNNSLVYADATSPNVFTMLTGTADIIGSQRNPIPFNAVSHFLNMTGSKDNLQAMNAVYFEGYIDAATTVTLKIYKQFESSPFLYFNFSGTNTPLLDGSISGAFLGDQPLGLQAVGTISNPDDGNSGRQHFQFRIYFPYVYANYFAHGVEGTATDMNFELIRVGYGLKSDPVVNTSKIVAVSPN